MTRLWPAVFALLLTQGGALVAQTTQATQAMLGPDMAIVTAVQAESRGDTTRLTFDLTRDVSASAAPLSDPDRLVIDLPQVNFQIDPDSGHASAPPPAIPPPTKHKGRRDKKEAVSAPTQAPTQAPTSALSGLVKSFRFGLFAPGRSRIVIDLTAPARVVKVATEPNGAGRLHLVIALERTDRAHFKAAAEQAALALRTRESAPTASAAPADKPAPPSPNAKPLVVLDAGHGGVDTGALGAPGVVEKEITFAFASALKARLEASGQVRVLLTRPTDIFVPLNERVQMARKAGADLFLSIHADTISEAAGVSGATVYTVSDKASDTDAARVAAAENLADVAGGLEKGEDRDDVTDILVDLTRRETRAYSHVFAKSIVTYWRGVGRLNKNPERSAGFVVLKAPDVPSVLLELGYLSNPQDSQALTSADWRAQAVAGVEKSIQQFFAPRAALQPAPAAAPARSPAPSAEAASKATGGAQLQP